MFSRRFLLSALFAGAVVLATARVAAQNYSGNYAISNATETGNVTFFDTINGFPPTPVQPIPVANATVEEDTVGSNYTFTLTASGTLPATTNQKAQPITGIVDGNGTILVTGPRGSTGAGEFVGSNMTLDCAYLVPGGRVTYHYVFLLVPSP